MHAKEFGITCDAQKDEKKLVANVNAFLASLDYRTLYKRAPTGIRNPNATSPEPRYKHYYWQMLKQEPRWYFDLYPNGDLDGHHRFPDAPGAGWTLFVNYPAGASTPEHAAELERFTAALVAGVGFPTRLLHAYAPGEDRR